jgi:hemolysin III
MSTLINAPLPLSRADELANCATHALGFGLSVVGTAQLLRVMAQYGDALQIVGVSIYGATLVALYAASTLSHSFEDPRRRHFFRTVDQVCIFLLIAGTFTPISLTYLRAGWWWALFASVWSFAALGIVMKLYFTRLNNVAVGAYVLLGWLPVIAIKPILEIIPSGALVWLAAGGVLYTAGTLFLARDERVPFFHAIWHIFVLGGSACHYYAVLTYIVPWPVA